MRLRQLPFAAALLAAALAPGAVRAQCVPHALLHTLKNPAPGVSEQFGYSVAVSDNLAVIGVPHGNSGGVNRAGTAYVFDATTGALAATLSHPEPMADDSFGGSVAISGNVAVVGVPSSHPGGLGSAGTAYVFNATTGVHITTLSNPDPTIGDSFGYSVAISGDLAVVGAYGDNPGGVSEAGTAYVFDAKTGVLIATLNNPSPQEDDYFGGAVAVSGNVVVVGAIQARNVWNGGGRAYVFDAQSGALTATLNNPAPEWEDSFGQSVAISGNVVVVGADRDESGGVPYAGAAYVFDAATGALTAALHNPTPDQWSHFGGSVAVSGEVAVVGASLDDSGGLPLSGRGFIFDVTTGALIARLNNPQPRAFDEFGNSVGISGNTAVFGAHWHSSGVAGSAGTAYVFSCPPPPASVLDYLLGRTSDPAGLDANGDQVIDAADLLRVLP